MNTKAQPQAYLIYIIPLVLSIISIANHYYLQKEWLISPPYIFSATMLPTVAIQLKRRYSIGVNRMVLHGIIAWLLCAIVHAIVCFALPLN